MLTVALDYAVVVEIKVQAPEEIDDGRDVISDIDWLFANLSAITILHII